MHILLVNVFFAPESYGGATVVAEEVARALVRDHGHRVTAISAASRADLAPYATILCEQDGIANHMINLPQGRSFAEHYANPQVAEAVARIARAVAPDLAHLHCLQEIGADCIAALKALDVPVILSTHDYWWLCERQFMLRSDGHACPQDPVRAYACRGCIDDVARTEARADRLFSLAALADLVTAPSTFAAGMHRRAGFAPGRVVVWENGVTPPGPGFAAMQAARRAADPRTVFGFLGGPSMMKGWPLIADAFTGLGQSGFRGVVVDGSLDGTWWRGHDLARLDGEWSVLPGYGRDGIDAVFAGIDVLLFPSRWHETFGLTVREALCRGVRVIQTEAGGAIEHDRADAVRMLPLDATPEALRRAVLDELRRPIRGAMHRPVRSVADQARAFLALAEPLLGRPVGRVGAA